jgi:lambda repressor-like predicted transcriptional regulator
MSIQKNYYLGWPPNKIRGELITRHGLGIISQIAKRVSKSYPTVSQTISGRLKTRYVRLAIAEALNEPIQNIWPEEPPVEKPQRRKSDA